LQKASSKKTTGWLREVSTEWGNNHPPGKKVGRKETLTALTIKNHSIKGRQS